MAPPAASGPGRRTLISTRQRWLALAALLVACGGSDGAAPETDSAAPETGTAAPDPDAATPAGFAQTAAEVTMPDGTVCPLCLWVADTPDLRARGLMGVTDLGGADGMVFTYETPSSGAYYMWNTPTPLSIAFFGSDGLYVSEADMAPCLEDVGDSCPRYRADAPFTAAIETIQGGLDELGIVPGSRLAVLGQPCR